MSQCSRCHKDNPDHRENCQHCGQYLPNEDDQLRIAKFKWWFVAIVIFCFVMFFALPR